MGRASFEDFIRSQGAQAEGLAQAAPPSWIGHLPTWDDETELERVTVPKRMPRKGRLAARVASVQSDVSYSDPLHNLERAYNVFEAYRKQDIDLFVFPECYLTGYCCPNRDAAESIALSLDSNEHGGWCVQVIKAFAETYKCTIVMGFAEKAGGNLYNSAVIVTPKGVVHKYRKVHLPELGFDMHATPGDELVVADTPIGRIGILICFDLRFPEAARTLALKGAELIVVPTNWPTGAHVSANILTPARAAENKVFVITCNRTGDENGFSFIGESSMVDPMGTVLEHAGVTERVLVTDMALADARKKRTVTIPGKYETDVFATRRPDLYGPITEPTTE